MKRNVEEQIVFYELQWDTEFFGVKSAKAILEKPLEINQWDKLKDKFLKYQFISIENRNSEPTNAQFIGNDTNAFLADVNIQFSKKIDGNYATPEKVTIQETLKKDDLILEMTEFKYSRFTEDPELAKRGGEQVYYQWLLNSFEKANKIYALSKDLDGAVNGFLLHSYTVDACIVELIAVSNEAKSGGIGTRLFKAVEYSAFHKGFQRINVGTQVRNMKAIDFYHKVGCKQVGCHQVYHLWNL